MKLLHVLTTLGQGGAENQVFMMSRQLANRGRYTIDFCYLKKPNDLVSRIEEHGFRVFDFSVGGEFKPSTALRNLARHMRSERYDIVHTHLMKANVIGGIAARLARVPRVISHKHNDEEFMRKTMYAFLHDLTSVITDDDVVFLSDYVKSHFDDYGFIQHPRSQVIHYGFDTSFYASPTSHFREQYGIPTNAFLFGTVARIAPQKGIDVLIEAFERLATRLPNVALLIAGRDGYDKDYVTRIEAAIDCSPVRSRIFRIGHVENPMDAFNALNCFVLASRWEGLGMVLLEAMATGTPIVATSVSAIPEVVRDGIDGTLVPVEDPAALAGAMEQAMTTQNTPRRPNQERLEHFSMDRNFCRVDQLYRNTKQRLSQDLSSGN